MLESRRERLLRLLPAYARPEHKRTFSVAETKAILEVADLRLAGSNTATSWVSVEICIDGKWLRLCRTDLKDDVCTERLTGLPINIVEVRQALLENLPNFYGARTYVDMPTFAVIDSFSDG